MIISASRRTDIPAFYSDWFFKRLAHGEVFVKNPFNRKQISRVSLELQDVDCFVFWTRNCEKMLPNLYLLEKYNFYFQFTLTGYGINIEPGIENKNKIIESFKKLSSIIGKERVIWRYDPIFVSPAYTMDFHFKTFNMLASSLYGYTGKCVVSFIDIYRETKKNSAALEMIQLNDNDMILIGAELFKIAAKYNISVESCAEMLDLTSVGIKHGSCVDPVLLTKITGYDFLDKKKYGLREHCQCIRSIDIGEYNSCPHKCIYCYANYNFSLIEKNFLSHDINYKMLLNN